MLENIITDKLNDLNVKYIKSGDEFLLCQCLNPEHNDKKPSMSINTSTGYARCFTCDYTLNRSFWVNDIIDDEEIIRKTKYRALKQKLKKEEKTNETTKIFLPPKTTELTSYRGINETTIRHLQIYQCDKGKFANRVIFPIIEFGEVVAFETRATNDTIQPKYLHSKGFNSKDIIYPMQYIQDTNYIVLVEGIIDAILLNQYGIPAITNWGVAYNMSNVKIANLLELGIDTIYLCLDKDEAGQTGEEKFFDSLLVEYFDVKSAKKLEALTDYYKSDCKDFGDYYLTLDNK